jgi:uncharacterized protein
MNTSSLVIDNLNFAKKSEELSGQFKLASFARLSELMLSQVPPKASVNDLNLSSSTINFLLRGGLDNQGRSIIYCKIEALLSTCCQRCLEPMPLPFSLSFSYLIAEADVRHNEESLLDDSDEYDLQEPNRAMDVATLIEDELLMAMPIAPTHDFDCAKLITQAGNKPNPFAALKDLVKKS